MLGLGDTLILVSLQTSTFYVCVNSDSIGLTVLEHALVADEYYHSLY